MMAKKEEIVKKEGRQLSFTLFYYLDMSRKKSALKCEKNIFLLFGGNHCQWE